jgi:hypothetical protein
VEKYKPLYAIAVSTYFLIILLQIPNPPLKRGPPRGGDFDAALTPVNEKIIVSSGNQNKKMEDEIFGGRETLGLYITCSLCGIEVTYKLANTGDITSKVLVLSAFFVYSNISALVDTL